MKHFFSFRKAKLLLAALMLLVTGGVSPAWAQVTESFEEVTLVDADTWGQAGELSNGWICTNASGTKYSTGIGPSDEYKYWIATRANTGDKSLGSISSNSNSYYMVIPVLMSGDITFHMCTNSTSSYTYGYVKIHKVTDNGDGTYTINPSAFSTQTKSGSSSYTWAEKTVSLGDEETMIAICAYRAFIDDFTYTPYVETGTKKPKNPTISDITTESATLSWTKGDEADAAWQIVYSTVESFDKDAATPIDVNTTSYSFSGLESSTTYYAAVRTYAGAGDGEQSAWVTTSFKTLRAPITSFPWSEDFTGLTSGNIPDGWDNTDGTTTSASYKWTYYSSGNTASPCLRFNSYNNSNNNTNFLKTPTMSYAQNANMQLKFWYKNPKGGDFSVYISNDGGATYTEELASGLTNASSWTEKVIDLPTDEYYDNVVIVFKGTSNYGSGDAYIYLDDILVKENASYAMSISGEDVVSNAITFGEVKNTSTTKTFTISNDGANNLTGVSVVSSDAEVFTVSDTGFDIAAGETKDITVTFVKGVVGNYEETITVSQANVASPIVLAVTGSYATPTAAVMAVKVGEEAVGETVAFGSVGKAKTLSITVSNTGEADLVISSITSSNTTDFTVSPSTLTVQGGSSKTFDITFVYDAEVLDAEKTATITVTPSNDGLAPVAFTVTGTRIEQWSEDFSGNALPDGWENDNTSGWTFADGVAKGHYAYGSGYYLTTPSLKVEDPSDELTFDYAATANYVSVTIQKSKNGGAWETCSTATPIGTLNNGNAGTATITGLEAGNYKFRFKNDDYNLDNFQGFKRNMNDPKMGIYSDEECTVAVATSVTNDFGFATTDQTTTYYIKNDGTGTMTLSKGDNPEGFTATLDKTSVAAGEHATLTITMPAADNAGYHSGNIVVTATDLGTFTVAASGVVVDENKLYLDFSSDNIPATWTANNWSKNGAGYLEQTSYTKYGLETAWLNAEADEELVIEAQNTSTSSYYTFAVNYKKEGDEEWTNLIAEGNIGNTWNLLRATLPTAGKYQLQFIGNYARIRKIYGLTEPSEPVMVVYDNEVLAANSYDFGNVSNEADATWTLTVKNEGKAALTGLAAALSGTNASHYSVQVSATELAANATATITIKQLKDNLGAHSATLTISANDLDSKEIALSGMTYDHTRMFIDFEDGNLPAGWTKGANWSVGTQAGGNHALSTYSSTATTVLTSPLTVESDEILLFDATRYYSSYVPTLKVRYTIDAGNTWSDYVDYSSQITNSYSGTDYLTLSLTDVPAGTVMVEFTGAYVRLDNIIGFAPTTAPVLSLTESAVAVASGSTKEFGNLTEAGTATYTLSNTGTANLVSTVATTGIATAAISGEGEGVTISENTVTLEPGKSATITLTLPFVAPYGDKAGAMTISSEGWVGDMVVNYTATTIDPTALYVDFNDNTKPAGWYQQTSGWTISAGRAHVYTGVAKALVTEQYAAEDGKNVLRFDAKKQSNYADGELKVYTSTDRNTWMLAKTVTLTEEDQAVALDALEDGNYYVKFESLNASIDNLTGLKRILPAPEHDLFVTTATFPTTTLVPGTVAGVNVTATVASLRANETGVYAKLFFDEDVIGTAEPKTINLSSEATFTITCNVPATEKTYDAKVVVYYSNDEVAFETATTDVEVAHTRTLNIASFTRTDGDGALDADGNNQISPAFSVTVENTGSTAGTPTVKIYQNGNVVATATAAAAVAAGATSEPIALTATNMSAGEGGELAFTAKAFWDAEDLEAKATSASDVIITVNAAAPMFALYQDATPVNNGDDVDFGLVKGTTKTFSYTIKNEGNADLVLKSIVAPAGFTATEVTDGNKTIAPAGTLDIDVTLNAEQGIVAGNLVITYRVDESTDNTFTLALSGRSVSAATWTEDFEGGVIPANWNNSNAWTVGEIDDNHYATLTGWDPKSIVTPRLAAKAGDILTFDVLSVGNSFSFAYSTDQVNWSDEMYIYGEGQQTFVAYGDGNYYLRFTTRNGHLDNLVGFELNPSNYTLSDASADAIVAGYYDNVTLNRSFANASWNSVCLPFAVDNVEEFFGAGAFAYAFTGYDADALNFETVTSLVAGQPYVVYVATGFASKELTNVALVAEAGMAEDDEDNVKFRGTFAPIVAGGFTADGLAYGLTPKARIAKLGDGASSKGFRAYFDIPAGAPVKALVFDGGIATGVRTIRMTADEAHDIFDLSGRKLSETRKGVNIINGKKVLVK